MSDALTWAGRSDLIYCPRTQRPGTVPGAGESAVAGDGAGMRQFGDDGASAASDFGRNPPAVGDPPIRFAAPLAPRQQRAKPWEGRQGRWATCAADRSRWVAKYESDGRVLAASSARLCQLQ
jgi:hypothetical protein